MLQPKRSKYRKQFRGKRRGIVSRGNTIAFGEYGLKALSAGWVSANQIEAARVTLARKTRKGGKMWIRIFPHKPITSKPNETGMGSGKGEVVNHVSPVRRGRVLFEISGLPEVESRAVLRQAAHKLSVDTKILSK